MKILLFYFWNQRIQEGLSKSMRTELTEVANRYKVIGLIRCYYQESGQIFSSSMKCENYISTTINDSTSNENRMAAYVGKYDRTSAENFNEFLYELGVNFWEPNTATVKSPINFEVNNDCCSLH